MRSIRPVIAGNGLAILLTVVFLLPTTAVVAFVATGLSAVPLGDAKQFDVADPCADMLYFFGFVDRGISGLSALGYCC